jgi:hypothetical protein
MCEVRNQKNLFPRALVALLWRAPIWVWVVIRVTMEGVIAAMVAT